MAFFCLLKFFYGVKKPRLYCRCLRWRMNLAVDLQ